ncbi:MAG: prolyl oligopeptidase family serine peptidase [Vicinamibacterales bacterium]
MPNSILRRLLTVGLIAGTAACTTTAPPVAGPPATRTDAVVDTIQGETFPDPYRWLEAQDAAETREWLAAQGAYADRVLPRDDVRLALETRIRALSDRAEIGAPRRGGAFEYFTLRRVGEELASIVRRSVPDAAPGTGGRRDAIDPTAPYDVVVDPAPLSDDLTTRVEVTAVDRQGRHLLYGVRDGGQDEFALKIRDLGTGQDLPDHFPAALYSSVVLTTSGDGFYYSVRSRQTGARIRRHAWGTDPSSDPLVFGEGYGPTAFVSVLQSDDGAWLVFTVQHGWATTDVFALDLRAKGGTPFAVVEGADARFYPRFVNGELWMRTDLDAPRNRVVAVDLRRPARAAWRTVIAEQPEVIEDVSVIGDTLVAQVIDDGANRLITFTRKGERTGELAVPPRHSASIRGDGPGRALVTLESFDAPETTWRVDLATGTRVLDRGAEIPFDGSGMTVTRGDATSKDGTTVPVWVLHKTDLPRTGTTPTLLFGYGGFYAAQKPSFSPMAAAWVEHGGVYAMAVLRGGSEFGETWHRDGMLTNKQHVFDDFVAAAEWLVRERYTSPAALGIMGTSNGGLLVGAALTQRPDLFRAVLCGFPDVDILRFNQYTANNNMPALLEYGDAAIKAQFDAIKQYSPYQQVRAGTAYPAVMLSSGDRDTRVPPLAARKFTARLQASSISGRPVILRYHPKAGHAANRGLPFSRRVEDTAAEMAFMAKELGLPLPRPGA